jgi:hypothetical protein
VGQAGGIVDGDVEVLPADAAAAVDADMVAANAMTDAGDPAELLAVDVDQFAGCARWQRTTGGFSPSAASRPRPSRRKEAPTEFSSLR